MARLAISIALIVHAGCSASGAMGGMDLGGGGAGGGGGGGSAGSGGGGGGSVGDCVPACPADQLCQTGTCTPITAGGLVVDAGSGRHAIHPEIYGLAFASPATLQALRVPLNRWGGDGTTLFNWKTNVGNHDFSYYYENIPGDSADSFVSANTGAGAATLMTIPTIGWTPKTGSATAHPYTCGYPTDKYPNQQMIDPYDSHCGNGKDSTGKLIAGDPTNDSEAVTPAFEAEWVQHLGSTVTLFQLDNEMMLWPSTHHDVRSTPVSSDDVWSATLNYAPAIKDNNASAYVLGYTAWYALDLFVSGLDTANNNTADQAAHGGIPLAEWYLRQLKTYEQQNGKRLVDCLDFHYYPQGGDPLENTRSLWDATYHDPSWFNDFMNAPMELLPRVQGWIAAENPGIDVCVSEYNWDLNDATNPVAGLVEADVLGLFGKLGVRLAAYWTTPVDGNNAPQPAYRAFQLYRNADGAGQGFGDTSVAAASALAKVALYGAIDSATGALTVLVINKDTAALSAPLTLENFAAGASAKVWQVVEGGAPTTPADYAVAAGAIALSVPAHAMQLIVVPKQ
ncbi:MAG TPA: glycoside hydrolase family 44 protein [Polyangia bacterium]